MVRLTAFLVLFLLQTDGVNYRTLRTDGSSVVQARISSDYGFLQGFTKLFFDVQTKRQIKRIDYPSDTGLSNIPDQEVQQALGVDLATVKQLKDKPDLRDYRDDQSLPAELRDVRLPQSTYAEFARLRPQKVRNGYTKDQANIDEYIGPYVVTQDR